MTGDQLDRGKLDLLQAALDHIDQGFTVFDSDLRLIGCNERFFEFLEFPRTLGREGTHFSEFMRYNAERGEYGPGDIEDLVSERVDQAKLFHPHYFERDRPNGQVVAVRGEPLPNGGFVTTYTDITQERKRQQILEEKVAERTSALRESEQRLRLITDAIPALIAYIDRQPAYTFANRRYAQWFGCSPDTILGRPVAEVIGGDLFAELEPRIRQALDGEAVTYEYTRDDSEGNPAIMRSTLIPDHDTGGQVRGCFVLSLDMTEQRAQEAALRQAQKMQAVGQLTSGIVHDFNNLLTVILGNLLLLERRVEEPELIDEAVRPSIHAARRSADLTGKLLAFARARALRPSAVNVSQLLGGMAAILQRSLPPGIDIVFETRGAPRPAYTDATELENALLNLVLNARDAIEGRGTVSIAVRQETLAAYAASALELKPGDFVCITVHDNGRGMTETIRSRAFEPFFTTKPARAGSGLGLSAVYGFVRQSMGAIDIETAPGKGTKITLFLPCAEAGMEAPPESPDAEARPSPEGRNELVLLVEDDTDVRAVIRRQLLELGYSVVEAEDARHALQLLETVADIRYLLSDIVMPGEMDGVALARQVKQQSPQVRVALMSGYAERSDEESDPTSEIPTLEKPFQLEALSGLLRRAL